MKQLKMVLLGGGVDMKLQNHPAIKKMLKLRHPKARYWLNVAKAHDIYEKKLNKVLRLNGRRINAFSISSLVWAEESLKLADAELAGIKMVLKPIPWAEFVADGFCTEKEHAAYFDVGDGCRPIEPAQTPALVPKVNSAQPAQGGADNA